MKYCRVIISILSAVLLFFTLTFTLIKPVSAQSTQPQFLFSWRASDSYAPSFYKGKVLPRSQSQITAIFELVSGGKTINIANQSIYWYLDDTLIGGGTGVQQVTFSPFGTAPEIENLRVEMPGYSSGYLIHQVAIPVVNPMAVINAPYSSGQFSETNATATALAYFFGTPSTNLAFTWSVNGQSGKSAENPDILEINLPKGVLSGSTIAISLQVQDSQNNQSANASENLTYQSQL